MAGTLKSLGLQGEGLIFVNQQSQMPSCISDRMLCEYTTFDLHTDFQTIESYEPLIFGLSDKLYYSGYSIYILFRRSNYIGKLI